MTDAHEEVEPRELVHRMLDGTISDDEGRALNDWINADPANARRFAELALLHDQLRNEHASRRTLAESGEVANPNSVDTRPTRRRLVAGVSTVAVVLVVATIAWFGWPGEAVAPAVAVVSGDVAVRIDGRLIPFESGDRVEAGSVLVTPDTRTVVAVRFEDGTRMLIPSASEVEIAGVQPKEIVVRRGSVSATVVPQPPGEPMVVRSAQARADVLGTVFSLSASSEVTELEVTEGRVRLTRADDGRSLTVDEGQRAVARAESREFVVEAVRPPGDHLEEDFERGLAPSWVRGRFVTEALPPGSRGAIADERIDKEDHVYYAIDRNDWLGGLFRVHSDTHLHFTFRMEEPGWVNVLFLTRADDPESSDVELWMFDRMPEAEPGRWYEAVIPLASFLPRGEGEYIDIPFREDRLCFGLAWSWVDAPRGLVIDRVRVVRGGAGVVELRQPNDGPLVEPLNSNNQ